MFHQHHLSMLYERLEATIKSGNALKASAMAGKLEMYIKSSRDLVYKLTKILDGRNLHAGHIISREVAQASSHIKEHVMYTLNTFLKEDMPRIVREAESGALTAATREKLKKFIEYIEGEDAWEMEEVRKAIQDLRDIHQAMRDLEYLEEELERI